MTAFVDYQTLFPDSEEIRHLIVSNHPRLPPDRYSLNERYCADPACDCQRVLIEVVSVSSRIGQASVVFAFTDEPDKTPDGHNPYLEPMRPQGQFAAELLDLVTQLVESDVAYAERLERHYDEVKQFMLDHPDHDLHRTVAADRRAMQALARRIVEGTGPSTFPQRLRDRARERQKRKQQRRSRKRNR